MERRQRGIVTGGELSVYSDPTTERPVSECFADRSHTIYLSPTYVFRSDRR